MNSFLNRKIIATNIIALTSGTGAAQLFSALSLFLTARAIGVDHFGQYAASFAITKMTAVVFNLGLDTWILREGRRNQFPLGQLIGSILGIKLFLGFLWFGGILLIVPHLDSNVYPTQIMVFAAITTWLEAAMITTIAGFNTALRNRSAAIISLLSALSLLIFTWLLYNLNVSQPVTYIITRLSLAFVALVIAMFWFYRHFRTAFRPQVVHRAIQEIIPYTLSDALVVLYTQADITIVAMTLGKAAAGIYSPASSLMRALFFIPQAIYTVMTPIFSQLVSEKSPKLKKVFANANLIFAGIGMALWLGVRLLGPWFLTLILGQEFSESSEILKILGAILLIKSGSLAMAAMIVAIGYQKQRVLVQAFAAFVNITLNLLVINMYGIKGVAYIYIISELILFIGYFLIARLWLQFKGPSQENKSTKI